MPGRGVDKCSRSTRTVLAYYAISMLLVLSIVALALFWCTMNELRLFEGPVLFVLEPERGLHLFDAVVIGAELVLVALLSITLLAGFSRGR